MKNDLNTGIWQDNIWCPINIILLCSSDVPFNAATATTNATATIAATLIWLLHLCPPPFCPFPLVVLSAARPLFITPIYCCHHCRRRHSCHLNLIVASVSLSLFPATLPPPCCHPSPPLNPTAAIQRPHLMPPLKAVFVVHCHHLPHHQLPPSNTAAGSASGCCWWWSPAPAGREQQLRSREMLGWGSGGCWQLMVAFWRPLASPPACHHAFLCPLHWWLLSHHPIAVIFGTEEVNHRS